MMASPQPDPLGAGSEVVEVRSQRRRCRRASIVDLTQSDDECELIGGDDEVILIKEKHGARTSKPKAPPSASPLKQGIKCPVCLEIKENGLCSPPCGHIVCKPCMDKIMATRMVCPMCRKRFSSKRVLQLHCAA